VTSRLADQQSAYLRSAKDQPVEWYPWGTEAFERAREEDRPVLLDIGAVWCHWCHVMDHESYEDAAVAELLNREWVCIKVDRDERPDVDARYQRAVQALTGQGGWPLTGFLTPDGEVFFGGTYFPPDGKYGRPGFRAVLTELAKLYREDPDRVAEQARVIRDHLRGETPLFQAAKLSERILVDAGEGMARQFDFRHGGFGSQPKFPHPAAYDFLLTRWLDTGETWTAEIVGRTLTAMARGGIRDHLGGGFHRYSVDARWIVPHFEKMCYDNSELLRAYLHAASAPFVPVDGDRHDTEQAAIYLDAAADAVRWIQDVMSQPDGGYYASQDADVGPEDDGDYFTWTPDEARSAVSSEEFEVLALRYHIEEQGEMQHDPRKNVLWIAQSPAEIAAATGRSEDEVERLLASGADALRTARAQRTAPFVDRTVYTGWNALMASAMLDAAPVLNRPDLEAHALATLELLFAEAAAPGLSGGMRHALGSAVSGLLDDQVMTAQAALDAFEATGDGTWLERAEALMAHVLGEYRAGDGGLRDTAAGNDGQGFLDHEIRPVQDSPTPSGNGVAGIVLARLAAHTGSEEWQTDRDEMVEAFAGAAAQLSIFAATLLRAVDWAVRPATHVVVVGEDDEPTRALRWAARRVHRPRRVLRWLEPGAPGDSLPAELRAMLDGQAPRAYVCAGTQCAPPAATPAELDELLRTFAVRQ
jgi:uncharacterized protein YyaL (SSP411 family)